jgi:hypothetical protein
VANEVQLELFPELSVERDWMLSNDYSLTHEYTHDEVLDFANIHHYDDIEITNYTFETDPELLIAQETVKLHELTIENLKEKISLLEKQLQDKVHPNRIRF